jgi:hypothetical protein
MAEDTSTYLNNKKQKRLNTALRVAMRRGLETMRANGLGDSEGADCMEQALEIRDETDMDYFFEDWPRDDDDRA